MKPPATTSRTRSKLPSRSINFGSFGPVENNRTEARNDAGRFTDLLDRLKPDALKADHILALLVALSNRSDRLDPPGVELSPGVGDR